MPQIDTGTFETLSLRGAEIVRGYRLHDVWQVDLEHGASCTVPRLLTLINGEQRPPVNTAVRLLFWIRSVLGRLFRLDGPRDATRGSELVDALPPALARASLVAPGTAQGPFTTLYVLPEEAAYEALNATVHAILVVALVHSETGSRFLWAVHLKSVGRITAFYMGLIDPFRRAIVYPGLESWLKRAWREGR